MSMITPTFFEKHMKACIITGLVAILLIIGVLFWAYSGNKTEKETKLDTNIGVDQGKNAVVTNLVTNQQGVVNNAANNTNQAVNALGQSVNRDSSTFNGGGADDRFCRDFPDDSSCKR